MLEFRILGPLEVIDDGRAISLGGQRQRALLAFLLVHAGEVVSIDRIVEELWGEDPPRTVTTSLQNAISQLRKVLGPEIVETRPPGYLLRLERDQIDADRFERLVQTARGLEAAERSQTLGQALALWRGSALADLEFRTFAQSEIRRLDDLRLSALEERLEADLELGRHADLSGELEALVAANPLRERLRGQLMLALYRSGRQAEALQAYHDARRALVDELGIEPGSALQHLHASILRQEAALEPSGATSRADDDHLAEVVRALLTGRLVLVLGPGEGASGDMADRLADLFDCPPEHRHDLTRISQYVSVTRGVGPLYDELHELFTVDTEPGPVHTFLATLPGLVRSSGVPYPLIVTTSFGHTLDRAFDEADEEFDLVSYCATGRDRGKFIHRPPDGSEAIVDVPNAYAELSLERRTVILKIHGEAERGAERARESFVISEDDYIAYLAQTELANVVPVTLAAKLRRSHFLFLGYPLIEWSLRVFLQRVFGDDPISYRSWAVQPAAETLHRELWRKREVEVFDVPLDEYVEKLEGRLSESQGNEIR